MRKLLYICIALFVMLPVFNVVAASDDIRVYDDAGLLNDSEYELLTNDCLRIGEEVKLDIIIVTTDNAGNKSSMDYADDFYDEMAFGYNSPHGDGILFLIDMDNREAWISTSGEAIYYFTDARIELILDDIFKYLPNSDYYNSCNAFIRNVETYMWDEPYKYTDSTLNDIPNNIPDNVSDNIPDNISDNLNESSITHWWVQLLIALGISGIIVGVMAYNSGGRVTVTGNTYLDSNSTRQNAIHDHYIKTVTTSVKKPTPSQSGKSTGSSVHRSSGGHSHGGGGRKF